MAAIRRCTVPYRGSGMRPVRSRALGPVHLGFFGQLRCGLTAGPELETRRVFEAQSGPNIHQGLQLTFSLCRHYHRSFLTGIGG
jgi:hypothetical protein